MIAMYFDALTLAAVADELRAAVLGARVQDVLLLDPLAVGLELYAGDQHRRHYLLLSAQAQYPRVHLAGEGQASGRPFRRGTDAVTPLLLRMRKDLEGAHLAAVDQPPYERVIELVFDTVAEGRVALVAECVERRANLVLVQGGYVRECAVRVGPDVNRVRVTLPGQFYVPPPRQAKLDPGALTPGRLAEQLAAAPGPAWRALVAGLRGLSPLAAQEVVFRATGASATAGEQVRRVEALLDAIGELFAPVSTHAWEPCLALWGGELVAYAPYRLTHLRDHELERAETMSAALERYYGARFGAGAYEARKQSLRADLDAAGARLAHKREALQRELEQGAQRESLRQAGELVLTYSRAIHPRQRELRAAYEVDGPELVIALDPELTPVQNAQEYFKRYEKAKAAAQELPGLLAAVDGDLAYLEQLRADLSLADSFPAIDEVRQALADTGWLGAPARRRAVPRTGPLRVVSADGCVIWVGRNARQNDELTFKRARPNDLWLHAHDVPGAHVIVACGGRPVSEETLRQAAELAARHSARRGEARVVVDVAARKHVRRIPGGRPGMVTYRAERSLTVTGWPGDGVTG